MHNKDCRSLVDEILINSPFHDKGRVMWQACSSAILKGVCLEKHSRIFRG